ncbi:type I polyketide synthase [Fluviibacter phosphoraccumulans]|uniref:Type I polyketide synthase n=1 Tax=Fluviibacter phosphoraccumulans TaxID=1751046 RepID=A0A7R6R2M7_9RHOO|nr:type I polyketide synthase [Fluviibacter phosphoraccumulans]BBU69675.1 type I polyketide synthase [Fluviibacter phosphoraccumulans]BBU71142.1 type I polyketide synthase [Fluviibacter phosphoraccumulans]
MTNNEPIAIVGLSFRFPGDLDTEKALWQALKDGRDLVTEVPADRWATEELQHDRRKEPGRSITFSAGVRSRIDEFDAGFFGISPREAAWMDPQQRMLLELAWEALENAGQKPADLAGSDCAVYVGISSLDYGVRAMDDLAAISPHYMTGNTLSIAANRLSYVLDLRGPSVSVDTACSSSLVALHHACNSLRTGEASSALVGGVSLLLHPYPFVGFTKASMLSADGRCRAFDESGAGYVRGEGAAVLMLKPLSKAKADGDHIHALILASGVNADGAQKTGITIPSAEGQQALMRAVLERSGINPTDIDYIEAHGTGTAVGDPVETAAIGSVYGQDRQQGALPIGSVKTNLGHMEAASGMAGLAKAILAIKHRAIPPTIYCLKLNPKIDFTGLNLDVVRELQPISKPSSEPVLIGVNSFGFGGANAHVILQSADVPQIKAASADVANPLPPLFLSARSDNALNELVTAYADLLTQHKHLNVYDIAYSAVTTRDWLTHRLAVTASSKKDLLQKLRVIAQGNTVAGAVRETSCLEVGGVGFVYSGNGAQWHGMGRQLLNESPEFAARFAELDAQMREPAGFSILEAIHSEDPETIADTVFAQPLLFAVQVCITEQLKSLGIKPLAVTGHSVGEVASAWASGALTLEQAIRVVCARSQAQGLTRGTGRMAAIALSADEAAVLIQTTGCQVEIAGINSPNNVTLSGSLQDLEKIQKAVEARGTFFKLLDLDYAFHSRQMDPIRERLISSLQGLSAHATSDAAFVSTVTGSERSGTELGADYWWDNIRQTVQFEGAIATMANLGCRVFLEIGPNAILQRYISETLSSNNVQGKVLPTLKRQADSAVQLTEAALRVQLLAEPFDPWVYFPEPGQRVRLPNYPWQRERYWHPQTGESQQLIQRQRVHPLLGWRLGGRDHNADFVWENTLDTTMQPWLLDHNVGGSIVFPGAGYVEIALAAAREWLGQERLALEELDIISPLTFEEGHARHTRLSLNPRDGSFEIRSRPRLSESDWSVHAVGRIIEASTKAAPAVLPELLDQTAKVLSGESHYALTDALGLIYGPGFRGIEQISISQNDIHIQIDGQLAKPADQYLLPPAVLDQCFQSLVDFFETNILAGEGVAYLPVKVDKLSLLAQAPVRHIRGHLRKHSRRSVLADFELFDAAGQLVAKATGCRFRAAPQLTQKTADIGIWQERLQLAPRPNETAAPNYPAVVALAEGITKHLETQGRALNRNAWHAEHRPLIDALVLASLYEAVQTITTQQPNCVDDVISSLNQAAHPFMRWVIQSLKQEGLLVEVNGCWKLLPDDQLPHSSVIWQALIQEAPTALPQILSLARIGQALPDVLTGQVSIAALQESIAQSTIADNLFDETPAYTGTRLMIEAAVRQLVESVPANRQLRVLVLTAASSESSRCAWELFNDQPNITVKTLNYADWQALSEQNTASDIQDLIILRHALHQDSNPRAAITRLYSTLSSGGLLLVAEQGSSWAEDLLGGLDANWWRAVTTESPISSLNAASVWAEALQAEGFLNVKTVHEPVADAVNGAPYLLMAQKPVVVPTMAATKPEACSTWLLLVDDASAETAQALASRLQNQGQQVSLQSADEITTLPQADKIVVLLGWNTSPESMGTPLSKLLQTLQALIKQTGTAPQLSVVTIQNNLANSAISGMIRVAMNEAPQLGCKLIDLANDLQEELLLTELCAELMQPDAHNEVVLTAAGRYAPLLLPGEVITAQKTELAAEAPRFKLDFTAPGQLRNLAWFAEQPKALAAHEVEIETRAVGLNFRDVMYTMGLLRDEAVENGFAGSSLGLEFAGIVKNVGAQVHDFKPGQAVMGFGAACFSSHIVTTANAMAPMPEGWSFEAAATVPTTFFTVYYALKHLANLQPGERVLIHGAAGGVGIAAIQLAQHLGADIYATAGTDEKRDFVRMLGVEHVYDSRNLDFAEEILADTQGEGVDIVLNSLAGEAIRRNLQVLKPFGRFLELGKRDFFENTSIGLRPFKDNISYFGIDADQLLNGRPELANKLFGEVMGLFQEGVLYPLPHRVFSATKVVEAFRAMQQSRHIGKIVVSMSETPRLHQAVQKVQPIQLDKNSTWLLTGGVSGFGLASAQWLASRGAGHLVLINRRGMATPDAEAAIQSIRALGASVEVCACDITDKAALSELIVRIRTTHPPIKGVLHAAAHFDDALITALNTERLNTVLAPKIQGAWNLHMLTKELPLEHFVLYSSVTTAIGNPAQANYVAANAALEGLARLRHSQGLPALAIGWGPIADAGYLTRNEAVKDSLAQRLGKAPLSAAEALNQLDWLLKANVPQITIANFDWASLARVLPSANSPRFSELNRTHLSATNHSADDIQTLIRGKTPEEVEELIRALITEEVSRILSIAADRIEPTKSLQDMGMDSLMAVELALGLEQRFKLQLPAMMLNDAPTVESLGARIGRMLTGDTETEATELNASATDALLKRHGELLTEQELHNTPDNKEVIAA